MKTPQALLLSGCLLALHATELLVNSDFENGTLSGWHMQKPGADVIEPRTFTWGTDIYFVLSDGGVEQWEVQILQPIRVRPGYTYTLSFGGAGVDGNKAVTAGICHNGSGPSLGGDGSNDYTTYTTLGAVLVNGTYQEFSTEWTNTDVDDQYARVFVQGGGDATDFSIAWMSVDESPAGTATAEIRMTQLGYHTNSAKRAVLIGARNSTFEVRDGGGLVVHSGALGDSSTWDGSGESVRIADFSTVTTNGTYAIYCSGEKVSSDFSIGAATLRQLSKAALKAFYYQRASTALPATYADNWSRPAGHPDTSIQIHPSAGSGTISAPKGWYDAGDYYWGSNAVAANQGILLLYAHYLTGDIAYRQGAQQQIDYLLGRNPLQTCYVTGFGASSPQHPHQYISEADGVAAPLPGFMVGGPHTGGQDVQWCGDYIDMPATSWQDTYCSYATNEVAINWNAALAYLTVALDALHNGITVQGFTRDPVGVRSGNADADRGSSRLVRRGSSIVVYPNGGAPAGGTLPVALYTVSGRVLMRRAEQVRPDGSVRIENARAIAQAGGLILVRVGDTTHRLSNSRP
ncbi:MAG: hypothetical protein GF331_07960 [Chitinivibrionales bacterium]|nr:hypothetical protein [Chitinivibrionales bacterium]